MRAFTHPVNDHNLASRRPAESFGANGRILVPKPAAASEGRGLRRVNIRDVP
jgi:hypothetical protein